MTVADAPLEAGWLHERFAARAQACPDAVALRAGARQFSYAEVDAAAAALAAALQRRGLGADAVIGLRLPAGFELVTAMLGVLRAGGAYFVLDPDYPTQRLQQMCAVVNPVLLIGVASDAVGSEVDDVAVAAVAWGELLAAGAGITPTPAAVAADDACYIVFTSGSTGKPNAVRVNHGNVAGLFANVQDELQATENDCWSALHSPSFGFSTWEIWGPLTTGGTLCVPSAGKRTDPLQWDATIRAAGVSVLSLTPSGLRQWLAAGCAPDDALRLVVLSGEALRDSDLHEWFGRVGDTGPRLLNMYALTETAGRALLHAPVAGEADVLGLPVADCEVRLLDPQSSESVANGEIGELVVTGSTVAAGYVGEARLTAERFPEFAGGDDRLRGYRTGDLARCDENGRFRFVGRADEQIKLRGYRIEPADVERALETHPQVAAAAVVAEATADGARLHAFVTPVADEGAVEFWPSLGEYQIYDALLYDFMSADEIRIGAYRRAFDRHVAGKVVLDIGTGKDAILARQCVLAGARHVYAIEVLEEAAAAARRLVAELGLTDRITVICADINAVQLPEPVELCTQGIVGNIGSSDGIAPIWNDARRLFAPDCVPVPQRCTTFVAPAALPGDRSTAHRFGPLAADYTRRIFAAEGREFDVRLCVRNFPPAGLLAAPVEFEGLDFRGPLQTAYDGATRFTVTRDGWLDGYLLWTRLDTDGNETVDFLDHQQAWLPVWFPLGDDPRFVRAGDTITVEWQCRTPEGQVFPDYRVTTRCLEDSDVQDAVYESRHFETRLHSTPLHRELLAGARDSGADNRNLLAWLADRLPEYMLPAAIHTVPALPLTVNRKLDRQALLAHIGDAATATAHAYAGPLEAAVAELWARVLERPTVGPDDNFFAVGGDSIAAVRLTTEVQRWLDDAVFLAALYDAPDVRSYAAWLEQHHAEAVNRVVRATAAPPAAGPVAREESGPAPLTWAQQSLYFLQQLYPENTAANEQFVLRLENIDPQRLDAAWDALLARHDVLRTRFVGDGSDANPLQQLATPAVAAGIADRLDLRDRSDPAAALRELAALGIRRRFDLAAGRLVRPVLVQMAEASWVLLVTAHHTVADGLCVDIINAELFALYSGAQPVRGLQFADYARWQHEQFSAVWLDRELGWWRERLAGVCVEPVESALPEADPKGPESRIVFTIDAELADSLRAVADTAGTTLFVTVLALWRGWLARVFRRDDFLVGSPATLRTTTATSRLLGCMVNNVAFRNSLDCDRGFRQALQAERDGVLAALDHSTVPFEKIVEDLQPERVYARHPLFQFMFQFEERSPALEGPAGVRFTTGVLPVDRASYWDMELSVTDAGPGSAMEAFLGVRSDLFDVPALRTWPQGLIAFMRAAVEQPDRPLAELPLLSPQQLAARAAVNATQMAVPDDSFLTLFAAQAGRSPAAIAVRDNGRQVTYSELLEMAQAYAAGLAEQGIRSGDVVGVHMGRSCDTIALLLAINGCGAAWLPLDTGYPPARLELMVQEVRPVIVIADTATAGVAGARICALTRLPTDAADSAPLPADKPATACILYTSGTTGQPKGMRLSQRAALGRCLWMWQTGGHCADEVFAQRTSLNFVDVIWECFGALLHGATVSIAPPGTQQDMQALSRWVSAERVTHLLMFPSGLGVLLSEWEEHGAPATLRSVITTGEPVSRALVRRFIAVLPGCRLVNTYGTSENWDITLARLDTRAGDPLPAAGLPVANTTVHVCDGALQPMPAGVRGDLYVGGAGVAGEYIDRPQLSAERFVSAPDGSGDQWFCTGDLAAFRFDGELVLQGRADRQLKLRGVRIEPGEIEALAMALPGVAEAALLLHGAAAEVAWLALYIVTRDSDVDAAEVRTALAAQLPAACLPAEIVSVAALPRTPSGKLDSAALADLVARHERRGELQTATETQLAAIWGEALGVEIIDRHDNFFALRGNSLLATRVIARICDSFGLDLPLAALFEAPTLAELSRSIEALQWAAKGGDGGQDEREVVRL